MKKSRKNIRQWIKPVRSLILTFIVNGSDSKEVRQSLEVKLKAAQGREHRDKMEEWNSGNHKFQIPKIK